MNWLTYRGVEITHCMGCFIVYDREFSTLSAAKAFVTRQNKKDRLTRMNLKVIQGGRFYKGYSTANLKRVI